MLGGEVTATRQFVDSKSDNDGAVVSRGSRWEENLKKNDPGRAGGIFQPLYSLSLALGPRKKRDGERDAISSPAPSVESRMTDGRLTAFSRGVSPSRSRGSLGHRGGSHLLAFPTPLPSMEEVDVYPSYLEMPSLMSCDSYEDSRSQGTGKKGGHRNRSHSASSTDSYSSG
ncbi:unnamed protein product [Notodromas monacha]|uniref:Uncharacterized protein n=1 Tax=Notodromas monacha TaxID=399045 RepID=A0A7R9BF29_9CRUS|nr:unnamed protein product [Notodromas monacha]CAG0912640.1 unnamed protein product [Notodromas monacha]